MLYTRAGGDNKGAVANCAGDGQRRHGLRVGQVELLGGTTGRARLHSRLAVATGAGQLPA